VAKFPAYLYVVPISVCNQESQTQTVFSIPFAETGIEFAAQC